MEFKQFRELMHKQAYSHPESPFYLIGNVDSDKLWDTYLNAFPNEQEKQEHNCNCCRTFIKRYGALVRLRKNRVETIWDNVQGEGVFTGIAEKLREVVLTSTIADNFITQERNLGTMQNKQTVHLENGDIQVLTWQHFYLNTPNLCFNPTSSSSDAEVLSKLSTNRQLLVKGLDLITEYGIDTVIEFASNDTLYRAKEYLPAVKEFKKLLQEFKKNDLQTTSSLHNSIYIEQLARKTPEYLCRLVNSVIGTVLVDISSNMDLTTAVHQFNSKMDPTRFKRPKAVFSARDVENATKRIQELGLETALERKHASIEDVDVNDVLFTNSETTSILPSTGVIGLLDTMSEKAKVIKPDSLKNVKNVKIDDFIGDILKKSVRVEVYFDKVHENSLMSLVTSKQRDVNQLFKWNNPFSWSYKNAVSDSILKNKVKQAGGKVEGELRISLGWNNHDDLDLHLRRTRYYTGGEIYYGNKRMWGGHLDVDMNAGNLRRDPVENIIFQDLDNLPDGDYEVFVYNFTKRESRDNTYNVELEYNGEIHSYDGINPHSQDDIFKFTVIDGKISKITGGNSKTVNSKEIWGLSTSMFHDVNIITLSPNYWGGNNTGNKHLFFFINKAKSDESPRSFFLEFLRNDLESEKRVFEALADKIKVEESENQLTGLGFSETLRKDIIVRVTDDKGKKQLLNIQF